MPKEHEFYRDNLEQILAFSKGNNILSIQDVMAYTGFKSYVTVRRYFPFHEGHFISAATLARCLCKGAIQR